MHRSILSLGFVQVLGYVFPLITLSFLGRTLSHYGLSTFLYAQAMGALLAIPVEYGFHLSGVRLASLAIADGRIGAVASEILFSRVFLFCVTCIASIPIFVTNGVLPVTWANVIGVLLIIASYGFKPLWYFQATDRYAFLMRAELLASAMSFLLVALVSTSSANSEYVILAWALPRAFGVGCQVFSVHAEVGLRTPAGRRIVATLRDAFPLFIHKIAAGSVHMATPVILAYLISVRELAAYQNGERIVTAVQSLLLVVSQVGFAKVMRLAASRKEVKSEAFAFSLVQVGFGIAATISVCLAAPLLLVIFWGYADKTTLLVLRVMSLLFPVLAINAALALNYLLPAKRDRVVVGAAVFGSIVSIALLFALSRYYGPLTGCLGVLIGELVMTVAMAGSLISGNSRKLGFASQADMTHEIK
jgi:polysaccharide transporter, PST family